MNKPNPSFFVWLYITGAIFFLVEWALGAIMLYYGSKWLGLGTTMQRVLIAVWLLVAFWRATGRHRRRKEAVLRRYTGEYITASNNESSLSEEVIAERMASSGRTRREVEEDEKYFGF